MQNVFMISFQTIDKHDMHIYMIFLYSVEGWGIAWGSYYSVNADICQDMSWEGQNGHISVLHHRIRHPWFLAFY